MYQVTVTNDGMKFWLRGTTWAFHTERGNIFDTREEAQKAIDKAKGYWAPKIHKNAQIVEFEDNLLLDGEVYIYNDVRIYQYLGHFVTDPRKCAVRVKGEDSTKWVGRDQIIPQRRL